jgi:hypothetical protein
MRSLQGSVDVLKQYLENKMDIIQDYIPQVKAERYPDTPKIWKAKGVTYPKRKKRFIVATIVYESLEPRIAALETTQEHLENLKNYTLNIEKQITMLTSTTSSEIDRIDHNIDNLADRLVNLIDSTVIGFHEVKTLFTSLSEEVDLMRFLSNITHMDMMLSHSLSELNSQIMMATTTIIDSIHTLEQGYLPAAIVAHSQLEHILEQTSKELYQHFPDYVLLKEKIIAYYKIDNVLYLPRGHSIIIQLPVYLKERNQETLFLYHAVSFHIPYSVLHANQLPKDKHTPSYTKITLDYEYIAVGQRHYSLFNQNQLHDCVQYQPSLVCQSMVLQAQNTVPSCLSSLFWNSTIQNVAKYCQLQYYFGIVVPANTFEDDQKVLIANTDESLSIFCRSDVLARKISHVKYALLDKNDLCHCKIILTSIGFIQQKIHGCTQKDNEVTISHPLNALVTYHFSDLIANVTRGFDYFATHDPSRNITPPQLKVLQLINDTGVLL